MYDLRQTETFTQWRSKLNDKKVKSAVALRLDRLRFGHTGDVSPVGDGISELRIHYGPGYRVYFQRRGKTILVLLCGGDKSTQTKDIAKAKKIAKEWSEKHG